MEKDLKIWILIGVVCTMATILGFIIKLVTGEVIKKLDEIVTELKQLTYTTTIQGQEIKGLQDKDAVIHNHLNEHSERILAIEIKCSKCMNWKNSNIDS